MGPAKRADDTLVLTRQVAVDQPDTMVLWPNTP